jgi:hypothetical protein
MVTSRVSIAEITIGGDRGYDTRDFIGASRALRITPHVAPNHARPGGSVLDARTVRHPGYAQTKPLEVIATRLRAWSRAIWQPLTD